MRFILLVVTAALLGGCWQVPVQTQTPAPASAPMAQPPADTQVAPQTVEQAAASPPYIVIDNANTDVSKNVMAAMDHVSNSGAEIILPWNYYAASCTVSPDFTVALDEIAQHIKPNDILFLGLGGGGFTPSCPGVPMVSVLQNYPDGSCQQRNLPQMTNVAYATAYVAASKALLDQAGVVRTLGGETVASHIKGTVMGGYMSLDAEMTLPARACGAQTQADAVKAWVAAGYTSLDAITTAATIYKGLFTAGWPSVMTNTEGGEAWSFPKVDGTQVLQTILSGCYASYGAKCIGSWNQVQAVPPIPALVLALAKQGMPWMLQFNATGDGSTTSCNGLVNGVADAIPANAACFAAMQATASAIVPPIAWVAEPADWKIGLLP